MKFKKNIYDIVKKTRPRKFLALQSSMTFNKKIE